MKETMAITVEPQMCIQCLQTMGPGTQVMRWNSPDQVQHWDSSACPMPTPEVLEHRGPGMSKIVVALGPILKRLDDLEREVRDLRKATGSTL